MAKGFTAFKMKVGMGREDDARRAALMRSLIGWDSLLMMDANSVWVCELPYNVTVLPAKTNLLPEVLLKINIIVWRSYRLQAVPGNGACLHYPNEGRYWASWRLSL